MPNIKTNNNENDKRDLQESEPFPFKPVKQYQSLLFCLTRMAKNTENLLTLLDKVPDTDAQTKSTQPNPLC